MLKWARFLLQSIGLSNGNEIAAFMHMDVQRAREVPYFTEISWKTCYFQRSDSRIGLEKGGIIISVSLMVSHFIRNRIYS
jgi:hypothetical protein